MLTIATRERMLAPMAGTVLLVHSPSDDRHMYAEYLRVHGYEVVEASTIDDGWARRADADVIVTGLMVPGSFDGLELVKRLRQHATGAAVPVIVLTARVTARDRAEAEAAGCDIFLPKPCMPNELMAAIGTLVARSSRPA